MRGILFLIFLFACVLQNLQAQDQGLPLVTQYAEKEYGAGTQNWSISQDNRGILYFGNNEGILRYDGVSWQQITINQNSLVHSLSHPNKENKIYVGGNSEIGYLQNDIYYSLTYLLKPLKIAFTDVRSTYLNNEDVFFQSQGVLIRIRNNQIKLWNPNDRFHLSYQVHNTIYVKEELGKLFYIKGDSLVGVPIPQEILEDRIYGMVEISQNNALAVCEKSGIWVYDTQKQIFNKDERYELVDTFIKNAKESAYGLIKLKNKDFALATLSGGLLVFNEQGKIIYNLNKTNGLAENQIYKVYQDQEDLLWLCATKELVKVEDDNIVKNNMKESPDVILENGEMWGCDCNKSNNDTIWKFKNNIYERWFLKGLRGLTPFKMPDGNTKILYSTDQEIGFWENNKAQKIQDLISYRLEQSRFRWNEIFIDDGMYLKRYIYKNNQFVLLDTLYSFEFNEIYMPFFYYQEDKYGNLAIIHELINRNREYIIILFKRTEQGFKKVKEILGYKKTHLNFYLGEFVFRNDSTQKFYQWDYRNNLINQKPLIDNNIYDDLSNDDDNTMWLSGTKKFKNKKSNYDYLHLYYPKNNQFIVDSITFKRLSLGKYSLYLRWKTDSIAACGDYLINYQNINRSLPFNPTIRKVFAKDSLVYSDGQTITQELDYEHNTLRFEYVLPYYILEKENQYSYFLEGVDREWSKWTKETYKEYTNLREGTYTFQLKAKNLYDTESQIVSFRFTVLPPWYRSLWAYTFYFLCLATAVYGIVEYNKRRLLAKNRDLEQVITLRTAEIQQAKDEIETQAEELQQSNQALQLANHEIQKHNEDVRSSINAAFRIQTAMLPFRERIDEALGKENYFMLYKPRDIVSGDFYYFEQVDNQVLIAVADCTGHGVPGAFMSMIGINFLEDIVKNQKITQPSGVLYLLNQNIRQALKQDQHQTREGMDMNMICIDQNQKTVQYAGAMNPLYYIQGAEFQELKATKKPIGGMQAEEERQYEEHTISFGVSENLAGFENQQGLTLYLCTDGYQDQFGGDKNRKFMVGALKKLLFSIHTKPMAEQRRILDETIEKWREQGREEQIDDITVMGLRIG